MKGDRSKKELARYDALDTDAASIHRINDRLLEVFVVEMMQKHRMREKTAREHAARVAHFGTKYLVDYEGVPLSEASADDIEDYLGNWYPARVPEADLKENPKILASLQKFYRFLYDIREIDREVLAAIDETCEDKYKLLQ